jgi:outer membrane autotransporter protein
MHLSLSRKTAFVSLLLGTVAAIIAPSGIAGAAPQAFVGFLLGSNESPPTGSAGTGTAIVIVDPAANSMRVSVVFSGLTSGVTAAHIHCCQATPGANANIGVATTTPTFTGFPSGVTSGTYNNTFDLLQASSYNPAFIAGPLVPAHTVAQAEAVLINGIQNNLTYLNIHTTNFPGGEIRALLSPPLLSPLVPAGSPSNAVAVAGAIDAVFAGGIAPPEFVALVNPATTGRLDTLLHMGATTDSAAAQAGHETMRQFLSLVLDPFAGTRPAQGSAFAGGVWGAIYGSHLNIPGTASTGSQEQTNEGGGLAIGLDLAGDPGNVFGAAASYEHRNFSVEQNSGNGHANSYTFGLYGRVQTDRLYLAAGAAYAVSNVRTARSVSTPPASGSYQSDFTTNSVGLRLEGGFTDGLAVVHATPFAAMVVDSVWMPQYGETTVTGSTAMALATKNHSFGRARSELGLAWNNIGGNESGLIWNGRAGWAHEFATADKVPLAFASFAGPSFTVTGARLKDTGFVSAGVMAPLAPGLALSGNIEGDFGSASSVGGHLQLRYAL